MSKNEKTKNEKPMTTEEVESVANYVRSLIGAARARAAMISPWLVFDVGRYESYFRGRIDASFSHPARGTWFAVDARIVGMNGDELERVIESRVATSSYVGSAGDVGSMAATLTAIANAIPELEAIAGEILRISKSSATHATIVRNMLDEAREVAR